MLNPICSTFSRLFARYLNAWIFLIGDPCHKSSRRSPFPRCTAECRLKETSTATPSRGRSATKWHAANNQKRWSRPVSRVLYVLRRDSHSSRPDVAAWLQQPTREQRGPRYRSPIWSCSEWGLPCRTTLAPYAVRSYRTLSPLPDPLARPSAVCSLLHWPSAHAAQELPGTLPCGARTFLDALACDATVRPTP